MVYLRKKLGKASLALKSAYYVGFILLLCCGNLWSQNFPWGNVKHNIKGSNSDSISTSPKDSTLGLVDSIATHLDLNNQDEKILEAVEGAIQRFRAHKPGVSHYHLQHLGEKLNFDSIYKIIKGPKHTYPKNYARGKHVVYGFHPYWMGSAWKSYDFKTLSHVAYFAYEVDLKTGAPSYLGDWKTTGIIDAAHADGCKVHLTVTTVGSNGHSRDMLNNPTIAKTCIDSLAYWVKKRNADGVCIDFEDMSSQDTLAFLNWTKQLKKALIKDNPDAEIVIAGNPSGESTQLSLPSLNEIIDYMVIMGYNYTYSGSANAGSIAPMAYPQAWLDLESTIDNYISGGISADILVLALPYYGYAWHTKGGNADNNTNTTVIGFDTTVTFRSLRQSIVAEYDNKFESKSKSSYYVKPYGEAYTQVWVLDSLSMSYRFSMIKEKKIAGVGMWALGYDNGESQLWNLLRASFGSVDSTANDPHIFKRHPDNVAGGWSSAHYSKLWGGCILALLILALILLISPKARSEVMNKYFLFPLAAFVFMVITISVYEYIHDYLDWMSPRFPWIVFAGTGILVIGFYFGRIWTDKRNDDR